jgi:hypothetical protein
MVSWMQLWWQMSQVCSFMRHAYACGWSLYEDVADSWSHRRYAAAYAVAQVTPRVYSRPRRY